MCYPSRTRLSDERNNQLAVAALASNDGPMANHHRRLQHPMLGLVMGYCGASKGRAAWWKVPYVCCMRPQIRGETTELSPDSTPLRTEGLRQMSFHGSNSSSNGMLACSMTDRSARDLQWRLAPWDHGPERTKGVIRVATGSRMTCVCHKAP